MSFDGKYDDRLHKIPEAAAPAIRQLDQLRSTEPTPGETFDGELARIIKEGQQTIVDLDLWEKKTRRLAHN